MKKILSKTFVIILSTILLLSISTETIYAMQVYIQVYSSGEKVTLEVESSDTIEAVKAKIEDKTGYPARIQRLVYSGRELEDGRTLADYSIQREDIIHLILSGISRVKFSIANMSVDGVDYAILNEDYEATLSANDDFVLPDDIIVKIDDIQLIKDVEYIYDGATGKVVITGSAITGDIEIIADAVELFDVVVSANDAEFGTVTGTTEVKDGTEVTVTATATEGYEFFSWTENGEVVSEEATYTFTVNSDRNLVAVFEEVVVVPPTYDSSNTSVWIVLFLAGMLLIVKGAKTWKTI